MPYLVAAVVLVGAVCLLNLLLTYGVIRRLREHSDRLNRPGSAPPPDAHPLLAPGTPVGDFATTTTDGEPVARDLLAGQTVVAFLAPDCKPCQELLPAFLGYAGELPGGRQQVLAVVPARPGGAGDPEVVAEVSALSAVARVVVEEYDGPLALAFQANAFPALYLVGPDGTVLASGGALHELPRPLAAADHR